MQNVLYSTVYTTRDMEKRGSLKGINICILLMKLVLDAVSRILLFSTWLYVTNSGHFCALKTVVFYYIVFVILFIYNIIFSWNTGTFKSAKFWIGKLHFG